MNERARIDYFVRIPHRLFAALRAGDLRPSEFYALVFLIGEIDRDRHAESVEFTLAGLADACEWDWSRETLRRALHALARQCWLRIEEPKQGGKKWSVALDRAAIDGETRHPDGDSPTEPPTEPPHDLHAGGGLAVEADLRRVEVEAAAEPAPGALSQPNPTSNGGGSGSADETRRDELARPPFGRSGRDDRDERTVPPPQEVLPIEEQARRARDLAAKLGGDH